LIIAGYRPLLPPPFIIVITIRITAKYYATHARALFSVDEEVGCWLMSVAYIIATAAAEIRHDIDYARDYCHTRLRYGGVDIVTRC